MGTRLGEHQTISSPWSIRELLARSLFEPDPAVSSYHAICVGLQRLSRSCFVHVLILNLSFWFKSASHGPEALGKPELKLVAWLLLTPGQGSSRRAWLADLAEAEPGKRQIWNGCLGQRVDKAPPTALAPGEQAVRGLAPVCVSAGTG